MDTRPPVARGRAAVRPLPRTRTGSWLNLLQAAITVAVAVGVAASAVLSSRASGEWHDASRQEITWSAALVEDLRHVYGDEAPFALHVAIADSRARALRLAAGDAGSAGDLAAWESLAETQTVGHLRQAAKGSGGLLDGDRYRLPEGGYDIARRLADMRGAHPDLRDRDPAGAMADGDAAMRQAVTVALATVPLVAVFVVLRGLILWSGARAVRRGARARSAVPDVGLVPGPDPERRTAGPFGAVALLGWILISVLPAGIIVAGNQEQRAHSIATRGATKVSTAITASSVVRTFQAEGERALVLTELRGYARELAAVDTADELQAAPRTVVARADQQALPRLRPLVEAMTRLPEPASGVDPRTSRIAATGPTQWEALRKEQNRAVDLAERAGQRGDTLQVAVLLASLGMTLSLLALAGSAPVLIRRGSGTLLALAVAATLGAYLL
ncbi:hypothetical protein AB0M36_17780 [Actinoplanes sp. NPDC051346]|uniref:hypothetical protein n=1 Tax=Actinoplanes sp. NPDC051346 TaxID=3155048 RepID=UPI00341B1B69